MATQSGIKVVFGYTGTDGIAATGLTGTMIFESHDYQKKSDEVQIKSASGALATRIFPEDYDMATLEVIPSDASTVAGARTSKATLLALRHTILNITACADAPELIKTNWFVNDAKAVGSNVNFHKVSLELQANAGITAAAA